MVKVATETIVYRSLADLRVSSNNYRHGDVGAIVTSILTFGFNATLRVWRDGVVKAGNHSLLALQSIKASGLPLPRGIREENGAWLVPCFDISHLSQIQADAFMIADNRLTALGSDDDQRLAELLTEIASEDAALLKATGYDGDDLDLILSELANDALGGMDAPDAQIDKADELREKWQTERGQLWTIGKHRLLCGDSTNADDVARVMGGEKPMLMVTDPPYGVEYDPAWRDEADKKGVLGNKYAIRSKGKVANDNIGDWTSAYSLFSGDVVYIWSGDRHLQTVLNNIVDCGFEVINVIVWAKPSFALSQGNYHSKHESCVYAVRKNGQRLWGGARDQCTLWEIAGMNPMGRSSDSLDERTGHGTQKPLECMARPIRNHGIKTIYDPFCGSGTTLVACEQTGRMGRGIEIDPRYVAVTLQRLADMGLTPQLLTD